MPDGIKKGEGRLNLIDKLKERQGDKSQMEFAAEIGISQGALSRIYSGDRTIGTKAARKIRQRFPELAFDLASFLLADDMPAAQTKIPV